MFNKDYTHNKCGCGERKYKYSKFCLECYIAILIKNNKLRKTAHRIYCSTCKISLEIKHYKFTKFPHHFCSKRCYYVWRKNKLVGANNPNYGNHKLIKENNPNWQGGKSFEEYPEGWTKQYKNSIRKKYNYTCQVCYKFGNFVHHIDYNKSNLKERNLIVACNKCHSKTNFNRDYWYAYFTYRKEVHS